MTTEPKKGYIVVFPEGPGNWNPFRVLEVEPGHIFWNRRIDERMAELLKELTQLPFAQAEALAKNTISVENAAKEFPTKKPPSILQRAAKAFASVFTVPKTPSQPSTREEPPNYSIQ